MATTLETLCDLTTWFRRRPGDDRVLIDREPMDEWFHEVAAASGRIAISSIGESTEGRPMWLLALSSPDTILQLDQTANDRAALTDPALLGDPAHDNGMLAGEKPVVLLTAGIHATEVGGVQLMPELVAELALSDDARIRDILERVILLVVPTLNPDGMDLVHDWYRETLCTRAEGTVPPSLYHRYSGHDNNRDWYTQHLVETRNVIDAVHRVWHPTIVLDLHQMGEEAPRYFIPPYIDPVEPHVHPLLTSLTSTLGTAIATDHDRRGHRGVARGVLFDSYSPTRSYQSYHGGVRILAEAASARIASPASVDPAQFEVRRGFDPRVAGVHNPHPWMGGDWRLRDIMDYHLATIHALLDHVSVHADAWRRDMWRILADEVRAADRPVYAIAPLQQQLDPRATRDLVRILQRGDLALDIAEEAGPGVPPGSVIVRSQQPFGRYAQALLDLTPYPEPVHTPYDVTSHCLPIHMGVEVSLLPSPDVGRTRDIVDRDLHPFAPPSAVDAGRQHSLAIDHRSFAAIKVVAEALRIGADVARLVRPHFDGGRLLQAGNWVIGGNHALDAMSRCSRETVRSWLVRPIQQGRVAQALPRIGVYVPWREDAIDTGWLRLMLDQLSLPHALVRDADLRAGELDAFDVLLFADQESGTLITGNATTPYPSRYAQGVGEAGLLALRGWIERGGTCIALDGAAKAISRALDLPLRFPLAKLKSRAFAAPGGVVKIDPTPAHPLMLGIDEPFAAMLQGPNAIAARAAGTEQMIAARFSPTLPLVSGWMRGEEHLRGQGAIADVPLGAGRVVAFAFRPHFRTQMLASYAPLINAIMRSTQSRDHFEESRP